MSPESRDISISYHYHQEDTMLIFNPEIKGVFSVVSDWLYHISCDHFEKDTFVTFHFNGKI